MVWRCVWTVGAIRQVAVLPALLGLVACGAETEGHSDGFAKKAAEQITNGQLVPTAGEAPDSSVVKWDNFNNNCTGLKIGVRRFLSGAHCIPDSMQPGSDVLLTDRLDGSWRYTRTLTAVNVHPTRFSSDTFFLDFAVFDVSDDTNIPVYDIFRPTFVGLDVTGWLTAYGADDADSSHNGQKQYAPFVTSAPPDAAPGWYNLNFYSQPDGANAAINNGDSGGPIFIKRNSIWEVAGTVCCGEGYFARVSAAYAWLKDPRDNVFGTGRKGFLLHRAANLPIAVTSSTATLPEIKYWDARSHSGGTDQQYWEINERSGGRYRFKNTSSGKCLEAVASGMVSQATCSTNDSQYWTVSSMPASPSWSQRFRQFRNVATQTCMATKARGTAAGTQIAHFACSSSDGSQRWLWTN